MNRRGFIQISSVALLPILLGIFPKGRRNKYSIHVQSNRSFGHLIRETMHTQPSKTIETECAIVGGGIAGLSAAAQLNGTDFLLFEAADQLGGSSGANHWKDTQFAIGAHYDLAYPTNFGKEVIAFLKRMNIIEFNPSNQLFEFVDQQYLISAKTAEQCFIGTTIFDDILDEAPGLKEFKTLLQQFDGKMPLPTRLIDSELHHLSEITFKEFIEENISLPKELENRISYQMLDDWGGKCDEVSALAGIHYYMCRPYEQKDVQLFSPPQGNAYFIEKMVGEISRPEQLRTESLVRSIKETEHGVELEVINAQKEITRVNAKKVIYAGQKHALPYILKTDQPLFNHSYAPWVVVNFICKKGIDFSVWQNDVLTPELEFLGFVNSTKQHTRSADYDVFTAYYCFSEQQRKELIDIEQSPETLVEVTIQLIEQTTNVDLKEYLEHVNVNVMGHAMPIPKPNYLSFTDVPQYSENIIFAGVDTGRLPLFYEACDSGIQAANKLLNQNS